jgi:NAD dependent epimerase/dehydratase family enzyme
MRLLLLGCSGFVGRELVPFLQGLGHSLTVVSRRSHPFPQCGESLTCLQLDPSDPASWEKTALLEALAAADAVVNLAGEPIAEKRWTPAQRQLLIDSRVGTTRMLVEAMARSAPHRRCW